VITAYDAINTYIGVIVVPASPSPFTPTSSTIYHNYNLNKAVVGVYITSETSIKILLFSAPQSYVATLTL
jgi:hypothetical protein